MIIRNAVIKETSLGFEDHGILTFWLHLKYDSISAQGFGGYALDDPTFSEDGTFLRRRGTSYGMDAILRLLRTLQVESWEKLPGTPIRVRIGEGTSLIAAVGHYLEESWFSFDDAAEGD